MNSLFRAQIIKWSLGLSPSLLIFIAAISAPTPEDSVVFKKVLSDGRSVTVRKASRKETRRLSPQEQRSLPANLIPVTTEYKIVFYPMFARDASGKDSLAWTNTVSYPFVPP